MRSKRVYVLTTLIGGGRYLKVVTLRHIEKVNGKNPQLVVARGQRR